MTTITMPRRLMRPVATWPARRSLLIGFFATLLSGVLLLAGASLAVGIATSGTIMPGVRVGGVDVSGLERADAEARLAAELPSLSAGSVTLEFGDARDEVVQYAALGRDYEMSQMLDTAFGVARYGNPLTDGLARLRTLVHPTSLPVVVHAYDEQAIERISAQIAERVSIPAVDAAITREGAEFNVSPSTAGRSLEADSVRAALATTAGTSEPGDASVQLTPTVVPPQVTTADAGEVARAARRTVASLSLTIPGATEEADDETVLALAPETIAGWISFETVDDGAYAMAIDEKAVAASVEALVEKVDRDAVNAQFGVSGGGLGGVIAGTQGRTLEVEESTEALLTALDERGSGSPLATLALSIDTTDPNLTTEEAEAALPQMRMVSSWTTNYVPGVANGFGNNISIPAHDIDGYTLAPGEWFSFWGALGPINLARGYTYGGAIIAGRSEPEGALAGGICSTSTTLFNAAMRFGLEMGERDNHYYYIDRYPVGLDATVFKSDGWQQDMTFRNDTDHPVVIRGFGSPGKVTFQLWSVPNGRTVALSQATTSNHRAATDTTRVDDSMAPGSSKRIESPHDGFNASVSRTVYAADGTVLHQNNWFSDYRPVNGIVLTGPAAPEAAAPPPAEDGDVTGSPAGAGGVTTDEGN